MVNIGPTKPHITPSEVDSQQLHKIIMDVYINLYDISVHMQL